MKRLVVKVYGRVQEVFFRHSAKVKADELNLKGFVRNEPDGSVHLEAEGEEAELKNFLEWCRRGPLLADVEKIEFSFEESVAKFSGFVIK